MSTYIELLNKVSSDSTDVEKFISADEIMENQKRECIRFAASNMKSQKTELVEVEGIKNAVHTINELAKKHGVEVEIPNDFEGICAFIVKEMIEAAIEEAKPY